MAKKAPDVGDYKYGFHDEDVSIFRSDCEYIKQYFAPSLRLSFRLQLLRANQVGIIPRHKHLDDFVIVLPDTALLTRLNRSEVGENNVGEAIVGENRVGNDLVWISSFNLEISSSYVWHFELAYFQNVKMA